MLPSRVVAPLRAVAPSLPRSLLFTVECLFPRLPPARVQTAASLIAIMTFLVPVYFGC